MWSKTYTSPVLHNTHHSMKFQRNRVLKVRLKRVEEKIPTRVASHLLNIVLWERFSPLSLSQRLNSLDNWNCSFRHYRTSSRQVVWKSIIDVLKIMLKPYLRRYLSRKSHWKERHWLGWKLQKLNFSLHKLLINLLGVSKIGSRAFIFGKLSKLRDPQLLLLGKFGRKTIQVQFFTVQVSNKLNKNCVLNQIWTKSHIFLMKKKPALLEKEMSPS